MMNIFCTITLVTSLIFNTSKEEIFLISLHVLCTAVLLIYNRTYDRGQVKLTFNDRL